MISYQSLLLSTIVFNDVISKSREKGLALYTSTLVIAVQSCLKLKLLQEASLPSPPVWHAHF